jgi:hypothetical protein
VSRRARARAFLRPLTNNLWRRAARTPIAPYLPGYALIDDLATAYLFAPPSLRFRAVESIIASPVGRDTLHAIERAGGMRAAFALAFMDEINAGHRDVIDAIERFAHETNPDPDLAWIADGCAQLIRSFFRQDVTP